MRPSPLPENAGLAFLGEIPWAPAQLTGRQAKVFQAAPNPTGRPNSDVIRRYVGVRDGLIEEHSQIDFPAHLYSQEAGLYLRPAKYLRSKNPKVSWWLNPHANSALRTAIARLDRYLATPVDGDSPAWDWIESERLPAASLLVVTRDDDFAHGILQSRFFGHWWKTWRRKLAPQDIVNSFPFPWPPATLLSALTRTQEEHRLAVARAARSGARDQLEGAVAGAYGGSGEMSDQMVMLSLATLHRERAAAQTNWAV